jgi:hypothetical protein
MGYDNILIAIAKNVEWRRVPGQPEVDAKLDAGRGMLYDYELVTFAARLNNFWRPHGFFRSCLLGLRRA